MRVTAVPVRNDGRQIGEQCGTAPGLGAGVVDSPCRLPVLVPPTRGTESTASRGWTQKVVRPATKGPRPRSKRSSVMLGTSETMRGSGPARGCSRPAQSTRSPITRACLRVPILCFSRASRASPASLPPGLPNSLRWRAPPRRAASRARTRRRGRASGGRGMPRIPGRRDATPSFSPRPRQGRNLGCLPIQRERGELGAFRHLSCTRNACNSPASRLQRTVEHDAECAPSRRIECDVKSFESAESLTFESTTRMIPVFNPVFWYAYVPLSVRSPSS